VNSRKRRERKPTPAICTCSHTRTTTNCPVGKRTALTYSWLPKF